MKCILMNKNTKVALIEYDTETKNIKQIYEIYNIDYAPMQLTNSQKNKAQSEVTVLNNWFKRRGIPSWRKDLERLLEKLKIDSQEELLDKAYGLSLSDQYWFREENDKIKWKDINFFDNEFEYKGYLNVTFSSNNTEHISLYSPNNTTDGMIQKAWIIENGTRKLVKGTYTPSRQEPINEWLASEICKTLDMDYCKYDIDVIDNKIVSKCDNFINSSEELIMAYNILKSEKKA